MKQYILKGLVVFTLIFQSDFVFGQTIIDTTIVPTEKFELLPYGDMDTWMVRHIKESGVIGGNDVCFHEIAKGDTLSNEPYKNTDSPWALSSVYARVSKVTKASYTVFPEERGDGKAARLETRIEEVKVFGLININVLASGTVFLGEMIEPITSTDNPMSKLDVGIPFTQKPVALQFDYKVITGGESIKSTGFGVQKKMGVNDQAEVFLFLQHRWEDAEGNLFAKRVATAWENYDKSETVWQNNHRVNIYYGDISSEPFYKNYMGLREENPYYARNCKGEMTNVNEMEWATENEDPTHIILQFSSSNGGAYIGSTDSKFWIDNVGLIYNE